MLRLSVVLAMALYFVVLQVVSAHEFTSYNPHPTLEPPSTDPRRFEIRADYPTTLPTPGPLPWNDPTSNPFVQSDAAIRASHSEMYMQRVLAYALEGNVAVNFVPQSNTVRNWYHAPWLHATCYGREYINGFTIERFAESGELTPSLTRRVTNWGGGFYNDIGAFTLGQVWGDGSAPPDDTKADFADGAVAIKLLFTTATEAEVPYLAGSPVFEVDARRANDECGGSPSGSNPSPTTPGFQVRLLQFDFAVKDDRAAPTKWAFGTFVYDASLRDPANPLQDPWERLRPVGLMWGTDETVTTDFFREGAFINLQLVETWINPAVIPNPSVTPTPDKALMTHLGMGGRLNGPVDSPISTCISCHGRSGVPPESRFADNVNVPSAYPTDTATFNRYFGLIQPGAYETVVTTTSTATATVRRVDYSLQITSGRRNYILCRRANPGPTCFPAGTLAPSPPSPPSPLSPILESDGEPDVELDLPEVTRGTGKVSLTSPNEPVPAALGAGAIIAAVGLIRMRRRL